MREEQGHYYAASRQLEALRRRAEASGARRDPIIDNHLALLEHDPQNWGLAQSLTFMLDEYEEEQRLTPNRLASPPAQEDLGYPFCPPDFEVGQTTETGVRYGPRIALDCGSIAITGITGGGKTSLVQNLVVGVHTHLPNVATLVYDVKGDFTCVASLNAPAIRVYKMREEVPVRLLQPPDGVVLDAWLPLVATYFCEYRGLKKSRHLFLDTVRRLCVHFGVDLDPNKPWPSLFNVLDYLKNMRGSKFGKDAEYKASLINELQGLLEDTGKVFDTCDGIDVESHLLAPGGIAVLQMETLPAPAQQMIISLMVERIIARRVTQNIHNVALGVLVVFDEAQLVLSRKADWESANGVAPLAVQLLRGRETGVGFIVVPHLLPDTSRAVLASAKTMFVVGGLSDVASIDIAAGMMNLPAGAKTMIPRLGRGQALVREVGQGTYTDAFLVDLDPPILAKDAVDEPTRQRLMNPKLLGLPKTPSKPLRNYPSIMAELYAPCSKSQGSAGSPTAGQPQPEDLLRDCVQHRDDWMTERRTRLKIHDYKTLARLAKVLEGQNLVTVHDVRIGRATYALIEITDSGWQTLGRVKPPHYIGHGGFVHTVLISRVAGHLTLQKWANVQKEFPVGPNQHPVDVYARDPKGVPTAFEITISTSNVVSNAINTLASPTAVQQLLFLCLVQNDCKRVENLVRKDPAVTTYLNKIQFRRVDEFLS